MSILCYDGFETGIDEAEASFTTSVVSTYSRTGDCSLYARSLARAAVRCVVYGAYNPSTSKHDASLDSDDVYVTVHFRFDSSHVFSNAPAQGSALVIIQDASAEGIGVGFNSAGKMIVFDYDSGTVQYTSSTALSLGQWYRLDVHLGSGNPAPFTVRLDGTEVSSGTAPDSTGVKFKVTVGQPASYMQAGYRVYFDDLVIDDAKWYADPRVVGGLTRAVGDHDQWLGGTWSDLNDIPYTADVYSNTLNREEQHECNNTPTLLSEDSDSAIRALKVVGVCATDSVDNVKVQFRLKHDAAESVGLATPFLGLSYEAWVLMYTENPSTSAAWVWADIDTTLQAGVKLTTTLGDAGYITHLQVSFLLDDPDPVTRKRFIAHAGI